MPFAKERGVVPGGLEQLRNGELLGGHAGPAISRRRHSRKLSALRIAPGQDRGASRRADAACRVELRKPNAARRQAVEIWRRQVRGAVAIQIDGALIVGNDQQDIGMRRRRLARGRGANQKERAEDIGIKKWNDAHHSDPTQVQGFRHARSVQSYARKTEVV